MKPYPSDIKLFTLSDFEFIIKSRKNISGVYHEILFPYFQKKDNLNKGFFVESWGRPYLPSECMKQTGQIDNIHDIVIEGFEYKNT